MNHREELVRMIGIYVAHQEDRNEMYKLLKPEGKQTAHVIMGNDFPDAVFGNEASANKYVAKKKEENEKRMKEQPGASKIYWRSYEFEVQQ